MSKKTKKRKRKSWPFREYPSKFKLNLAISNGEDIIKESDFVWRVVAMKPNGKDYRFVYSRNADGEDYCSFTSKDQAIDLWETMRDKHYAILKETYFVRKFKRTVIEVSEDVNKQK